MVAELLVTGNQAKLIMAVIASASDGKCKGRSDLRIGEIASRNRTSPLQVLAKT